MIKKGSLQIRMGSENAEILLYGISRDFQVSVKNRFC